MERGWGGQGGIGINIPAACWKDGYWPQLRKEERFDGGRRIPFEQVDSEMSQGHLGGDIPPAQEVGVPFSGHLRFTCSRLQSPHSFQGSSEHISPT